MISKKLKNKKGQSMMEFIVILPVLFFLILFGFQVFLSIYEAQVKQEHVRQALIEQIAYTANGGLQATPQVTYTEYSNPVQTAGLPMFGLGVGSKISIKFGICRNEVCGP